MTTQSSNETKLAELPQDVPVFLRKTYHMIDTCNTDIACWSEDGETFVVKDPDRFEQTIIPQFFKHSKFSSFVRQLNFYSFRKIKYADTIRIDPKLEAETANYWRFRHEKFRRGKPELLVQIKRMQGQKGAKSVVAEKAEDSTSLKSEVSSLKKRIEDMTKNIDELTSLVEKVSLKQDEQENEVGEEAHAGNKRKKVEPMPSYSHISPDEMMSSMDVDADLPFPLAESVPGPMPLDREGSGSSGLSDDDFVDKLFTAFADEEPEILEQDETIDLELSRNQPDPKLMKRLSDALALLPRDIQELIVDRLISAITNTDALEATADATSSMSEAETVAGPQSHPREKSVVPVVEDTQAPSSAASDGKVQTKARLPLAAATLAALMSKYGTGEHAKDKSSGVRKTLPVIPVHA